MGIEWQVGSLAALAGLLVAAAVWILLDYRTTPGKLERARRLVLNSRGRLADGIVTEATQNAIYYSYAISGVSYNTSQDISTLASYLKSDPEHLAGPVWLKYAPQNPANSIVICEHWSGLPPGGVVTHAQVGGDRSGEVTTGDLH